MKVYDVVFRGKRKDNDKWIQGYLFISCEKHYILWGTTNGIPDMIEVIPETVGQWTKLEDKNKVKIFEGDILSKENYWKLVAEYQRIMPLNEVQYNNSKGISINGFSAEYWEVIGNIHDNKELMER